MKRKKEWERGKKKGKMKRGKRGGESGKKMWNGKGQGREGKWDEKGNPFPFSSLKEDGGRKGNKR